MLVTINFHPAFHVNKTVNIVLWLFALEPMCILTCSRNGSVVSSFLLREGRGIFVRHKPDNMAVSLVVHSKKD